MIELSSFNVTKGEGETLAASFGNCKGGKNSIRQANAPQVRRLCRWHIAHIVPDKQ